MDKIKKYLIRGISIIMVAIVLVASPASDYLDTQGIGETHASGVGTLVTLGALMGVAGLAYGVYVDNVHQSFLADEFGTWVEQKSLVDVIPSITELKQGVTEFVITEALLYAIKDFFETEKSLDLDSGVQEYVSGFGYFNIDTLPQNAYTNSFLNWYENESIYKTDYDIMIEWQPYANYESGAYYVYCPDGVDDFPTYEANSSFKLLTNCLYRGNYYLHYHYYNSDGLAYRSSDAKGVAMGFVRSGNTWSYYTSFKYSYYTNSYLSREYIKTLQPIYQTVLDTNCASTSYQGVLQGGDTIEYGSSYGSFDQANLDKLKGLTVTENQLVAVQNDLFPQIDEQRELQASAQTIADLISFQLADSLSKNFAISPDDGETDEPTDTPTDTPTDGVTVGEQAIIDQSVANATGIKGAIQSATQAITDFFTAPLQGIKTVLDNIYTTLTGVVSGVVEGVKTGVKAILTELFVPDTAELEEAVYSMTEKFSFADSLLTLAEDIGNKISGANGPPVIYIDFSESEDERYQSIGKLVAVDFAWYERYKPYGDMILSAVLWCFFILRMFRGAPSIFKGMQSGMEVPDSTYQPFGNYVPPSQRIDMK